MVCSRKVVLCETPAWCWVLVWRRNIREAFPGEVTVEWVLRDALEFTRFIGGMRE